MGRRVKNLVGQRFGRLLVLSYTNERRDKSVGWLCICKCGNTKIVGSRSLKKIKGGTKSCGCLNAEHHKDMGKLAIKHGLYGTLEYKLFHYAKYRAKLKGLPFDLELCDIQIPKICPILQIPLVPHLKTVSNNSPTLDRIIPLSGYVKGNVKVISHRANGLKQNSDVRVLKRLIAYIQNNGEIDEKT